jgi:hypothetical protein
MTPRSVYLMIRHAFVSKAWSFPVSETTICWEGSASEMKLSIRVTRRTRLAANSSTTSQAARSVTTRRLFWRQMRFLAGVMTPCWLLLLPIEGEAVVASVSPKDDLPDDAPLFDVLPAE